MPFLYCLASYLLRLQLLVLVLIAPKHVLAAQRFLINHRSFGNILDKLPSAKISSRFPLQSAPQVSTFDVNANSAGNPTKEPIKCSTNKWSISNILFADAINNVTVINCNSPGMRFTEDAFIESLSRIPYALRDTMIQFAGVEPIVAENVNMGVMYPGIKARDGDWYET